MEQDYADTNWQMTPGALEAHDKARRCVPQTKREVMREEAISLYHIAGHYSTEGGYCLEIGTATGFSAAVMAQAIAPEALITLNPKEVEWERAVDNLRSFSNVRVLKEKSWDYHDWASRPQQFDFIFVDGDHGNVIRDLVWFDSLRVGGAIVFHDYTPGGSKRACQPVVATLDLFAARLGRPFDLSIRTVDNQGMVGFVRKQGECVPDDLVTDWQKHSWLLNGREWARG